MSIHEDLKLYKWINISMMQSPLPENLSMIVLLFESKKMADDFLINVLKKYSPALSIEEEKKTGCFIFGINFSPEGKLNLETMRTRENSPQFNSLGTGKTIYITTGCFEKNKTSLYHNPDYATVQSLGQH